MSAISSDILLAEVLDLVERTWGFRSLRSLQEPAILAMLEGRDSLLVLPTGGGKSLCYQAPAILRAARGFGPTVVISPLIALMKDQVDTLRTLGVAAAQLDSSLDEDARRQTTDDLRAGRLSLLFISPERLVNTGFQNFLRECNVRTFAVDEAHCVSHWGHDFRPEYRQLAMLKQAFPGCSVHGFTATATEIVRADICAQLSLQTPDVIVGHFDRPNLTYRILPRQDALTQITEVIDCHPNEAGIVYCLSRKNVDEYVKQLTTKGRHAMGYHAGMSTPQRRAAQEAFLTEKCDLIVATVAFGMGIDRSNLRFVIHAGMPKSIEAYQQETGRAGRDGLEAECVLFYSGSDLYSWKRLLEKSVDEARAAGTDVTEEYLTSSYKHIEDMDRYCRSAVCRHQALVEYFGQIYSPPSDAGCAACDHCLGDTESVPDAHVVAQKILSAVARTDQRFGINHIVGVLRGSNVARILQLGHDKLTVHGLLKNMNEKELRDYVYQLITQGVLTQEAITLSDGGSAQIPKLNPASWDVMRSRRTARLVKPVIKTDASQKRDADSWDGVDNSLFEVLRLMRKSIADDRSVPPYVIFSDNTLRDLARIRPTTLAIMRYAYGIGERRLADFGDRTLAIINSYCQSHPLPRDLVTGFERSSGKSSNAKPPNPIKEKAYVLFRQQASVDEVCAQTGRAASTIAGYLTDWIESDSPSSIAPWVPAPLIARIEQAIADCGTARLRPIFEQLEGSIPYDFVRIVTAHHRATHRND